MRRSSPDGIPYLDWGGQGPVLHFAHANGFPPGTYDAFVRQLSGHFQVLGMECRALWGTEDPAQFRHWCEAGQDLARFLSEMGLREVVAVGHSLGAVTSLYCAVAHPKLIGVLVLIDPVILPPWFPLLWPLLAVLGLNRPATLAAQARRRRVEWPSREVLLRAYRSAPVFKRWQEPFLADYIISGTVGDAAGGVRLRYPREWEARIFETPPLDVWRVLPRLRDTPVLVIRGRHSPTYRADTMRCMRWLLPQARFLEMPDADHFVPMCKPEETASAIVEFCAGIRRGHKHR
jgi:pimeloyl-ACP methyl ester carboxylesterase